MKRVWLGLAACIALALTRGGVASATVAEGTGVPSPPPSGCRTAMGRPGSSGAPTACRCHIRKLEWSARAW
jgi:hypothetical protein